MVLGACVVALAVPHALRVFAIQFMQRPAEMTTATAFARALDCAMQREVGSLFGARAGRPRELIEQNWAGTESSEVFTGYMDGAVRSGERAAAEVARGI